MLTLSATRPVLRNLHAAHPRVGDNELDGDGPRSGHRRDLKRLVIDTTDDETKGLADRIERAKDIQYTFGVAGDRLGDCNTRARLFLRDVSGYSVQFSMLLTLISLTCAPERPMMMLASWVTIKARIEICWAACSFEGLAGVAGIDVGGAEIVALGPASLRTVRHTDTHMRNPSLVVLCDIPLHLDIVHLLVLLVRSGLIGLIGSSTL